MLYHVITRYTVEETELKHVIADTTTLLTFSFVKVLQKIAIFKTVAFLLSSGQDYISNKIEEGISIFLFFCLFFLLCSGGGGPVFISYKNAIDNLYSSF